ncbi:fumarylacetoacetate hydrolase family protein, partial [Burkholderia pseudomallei]|uniref:fumarylacetoacetate hydrolase family protein n=1 Tax=Burkholderia pseudomallei TaxID=28450 RepID=UPI00351C2CBE
MELSLVERGERVATVPIGTVYGALLNDRGALAALGDAVHAPPYHKPPRASVLYVKPANTHAGDGAAVVVPAGVDALASAARRAAALAPPPPRGAS